MPISDDYQRLPLDSIIIDRPQRQRRELSLDDASMERSIAKHGVLNPIIITRDNVLVAGERRTEFSRKLGISDIPVRYIDELSLTELKIIELEENIKRLDLDWRDIVRSTKEIHQLYKSINPEWTHNQTGDALCLSRPTISLYMTVAEGIEQKEVLESSTVREAYNFLTRREARGNAQAIEELLTDSSMGTSFAPPIYTPPTSHAALLNGGPPLVQPRIDPINADRSILCEDFTSWWTSYSGPKFNFIHCDFPYGNDEFAGPQMSSSAFKDQKYQSTEEVFAKLCDNLCEALPHIMSVSGHIMFWYTAEQVKLQQLIERLSKGMPSIEWHKFPLIWHKTDNAGVASDPRRGPRHTYELALLGARSGHLISKVKADIYGAPTDRRIHPSCKPEPVLKHFFEMLVDPSTIMLDPTCGSGSALRAAEAWGARHVLGLEINSEMCQMARAELRKERLLRLQHQRLNGLGQ